MSFLESLGGGLLSGLSSAYSSSQSAASAKAQMAFQKEVLQNRYQWTVEDLKSAGLNPILATTGLSSSSASGASYSANDYGRSFSEGFSASSARSVQEKQLQNQTAVSTAQASDLNAKADLSRAQIDYLKEKSPLEYQVLQTQADLNKSMTSLHDAQVRHSAKDVEYTNFQMDLQLRQLALQYQQLRVQSRDVEARSLLNTTSARVKEFEAGLGDIKSNMLQRFWSYVRDGARAVARGRRVGTTAWGSGPGTQSMPGAWTPGAW